jgi:hypothetical protein
MTVTITKPTVGGSENTWGLTINNALDTVVNHLNSSSFTALDGAVSGQVVNSKAVIYSSGGKVAATTVELGSWEISESGGSLKFSYNGQVKFSLNSNGALTVSNNVTAYGTP